jgi:hypothetical protein
VTNAAREQRGPSSGFKTRRSVRRRRFSLNVVMEAYPTFGEDRQMLLYVQTWLPLVTVTLTAAIFFGVASLMMAHARS